MEGCAFALILLWVYTATDKLLHFQFFRYRLNAFPGIGRFAGPLSWGLPLVELGLAALLLTTGKKMLGFFASAALLLLFTWYLAVMLETQRHLPCTCGGVIEQLSWRQHLVFNLFFTAVAGIGIYCRRKLASAYFIT
jgi:hypothetical protein